jgi:hypothetical protein
MSEYNAPIAMAEDYWANSQFSVARYYGGIVINGAKYVIVNEKGITLYELSDPSSKHYAKDGKAIPPGKPADLVRKEWVPVYKKLGREAFLEYLKAHNPAILKEAKEYAKTLKIKKK